jgi:hypothetical protein
MNSHELMLPMFYRESLARILALERFRNLIETNIKVGITLYTDHKAALFENSLSNKGQLSAWKIAEVADLLSIVENLYRQGGQMLFADPLSRVCAPTEGWYDSSIPRKLAALFEHLPPEVRNNEQTHASVRRQRHVCSWATRSKMEKAHKPHIARKITHEGNLLPILGRPFVPIGLLISGQRLIDSHSTSSVSPQISSNGRIKWTNTPRQPIPQVEDINQWIGHQLNRHTSTWTHHRTVCSSHKWMDTQKDCWQYPIRTVHHGLSSRNYKSTR